MSFDIQGQGVADSAVLTCRRNEASLRAKGVPDERIQTLVRRAGLGGLMDMPFISVDWHLITALVERWRPETHTFHLTTGEATITLQDVEVQLGLPVDGKAVSGSTNFNPDDLCHQLLGHRPGEQNTSGKPNTSGKKVKLTWLRNLFTGKLPERATEDQVAQHARGYIL